MPKTCVECDSKCKYSYEAGYSFKRSNDCPLVEAIPKADYEARLKADVVAMLEEISRKFDEQYYINRHQLHDDSLNRGLEQGQDIIQEKINELKENKDERN
jgi:hypothetical protein